MLLIGIKKIELKKIKIMQELKVIVQEKYSQIAEQSKTQNETSCCGVSCGCSLDTVDYAVMADDYSNLAGYNQDADLGLGCGLPTQFAHIKKGDVVVDLGSGAGNDCFVARAETGETGKVIGIDFTPTMLDKAKQNAQKLGYTNIEFVQGDIENIPLPDQTADVVVSNCVFNLVPDKAKAFTREIQIPAQYITLQKQKAIVLPTQILEKYLNPTELAQFNQQMGIYSITVYAER